MTVTAPMPARNLNLVVPLPHEGTAMRTTDTAASRQARSGAVAPLIGQGLRQSDVYSTIQRSRPSLTPGTRTSTTATRTTTTRASRPAPEPSADSDLFEHLVAAYLDCRRTKRNSTSALAFEARLERNLCDLHAQLVDGSYRPGRSICFVVTRPKPREVWAADFRDRIVHHLLYNRIAPRFHARFTADSCACIPGRGTLYAARRLEHQVRSVTANWARPAHYLKCDLANFFVSILLHPSTDWLNAALQDISTFLPKRLQVRLNPRKTILQPVDRGVDFVGHVIKPWRRTTRRRTVAHAVTRVLQAPGADVHQIANSYFGLLGQASHSHHDRALLANAVRDRGHCVSGSLSKAYRRTVAATTQEQPCPLA